MEDIKDSRDGDGDGDGDGGGLVEFVAKKPPSLVTEGTNIPVIMVPCGVCG